jgi:hypothetical protein
VLAQADWQDYQTQAAEFFRSLGLDAMVDAPVEGARASHKVDVLVEFETLGVRHRWVVECKHWRRKVPKERVLTLKEVVNDVGADRGFLVCEAGFQSGAVAAARFSNVTLTSLADLGANAKQDVLETRLRQLTVRVMELRSRFEQASTADREAEPEPPRGGFWVPTEEFFRQRGDLGWLERGVERAIAGSFPVIYGPDPTDPGEPAFAYDLEDFVSKAEKRIPELDEWLEGRVRPS